MRVGVHWLTTLLGVLTAGAMSGLSSSANDMTKLYVTNSLGDDITVIDLTTFKVVRRHQGRRTRPWGVCAGGWPEAFHDDRVGKQPQGDRHGEGQSC
jgi:YVTN family beta-propeller protein